MTGAPCIHPAVILMSSDTDILERMKTHFTRLCLFLLTALANAHAANMWDGGGGDGLYFTAANWDNDALPVFSGSVIMPAAGANKQVNLAGNTIYHERVVMQGGYRVFNGRIVVAGGGGNAEIESTGNNTLDANYGTEPWGNSVKLIQNTGGTLTVNGSSTGFQKSVELRASGTIAVSGNVAPGGGEAFYKTGGGIARFNASATLQGASAGRFVAAGTLLMNGTANNTAAWTVNGGRLGGTGTLNSAVTVGATLGGVLAPGDPASANGLGTLTVSGAVTLGENATLEVELGAPGSSDRLALSGAFTLGGHTGLWVKVAPGTTPSGSYTIVTHGGARSGEFVLLDAPAGTRLDYATAGEVRVVVDTPAATENIIFPAGANVVNVTLPPYNAVPNDGLDDTAAIQTALSDYPNGGRIIYLPNGTYDVSDTLSWPAGSPGSSDYKRTVLQGQSRDGAILRLKNNAPLFQNPAARRAVIFTGPAPAQRFGNEVRTLTVHTGTGNPGASGIQFHANNYGGMKRVKIVSGDGQGVSGLDLHFTAEIGPLFVQDLEVVGFDYGIQTGDAINGIVLERVTVRGQNVAGVRNSGQVFSLRGFTSVNAVPALINGTNPFGGLDTGGAGTLLDARIVGLPGAENFTAITTSAYFYGRNIVTTGYARVLTRPTLAGNADVPGASLDEYQSRSILSTFTSPARSLRMPVKDAPVVPLDGLADWADVTAFGAAGNGSTDDTAAFQAAIDSGKPTVFIPPTGYFIINGDLILRGAVQRLTGTHAYCGGGGRIIVGAGTPPVVVIERAVLPAIVHQSARPLIVRDGEVRSITSTSSADLFIEDIVTDLVSLQNPRQHIWARQLNTENGDATNVVNAGAALWILGMKTERGQVKIATGAGGFTELLGAHIFSTSAAKATPLFTVDDAAASFACVAESNFEGTQYSQWVREKRGAATLLLPSSAVPARTSANGGALTLYTGFDGAPKRPLDAAATALSATSIALVWSDQSWDETGFVIERSTDGIAWGTLATTAANATTFTDTTATPGATFFHRIRATNATAISAPTATVSTTTPTLFQSWLQSHGLPANADPLSDADRDGLPLLLEYALGGTPTTSDTALLPTATHDASVFTFTYRRDRPELTYRVETSPDLAPLSWTSAGVDQGTPAAIVTASYPLTNDPRRFFRLVINTAL